MVNMKVMFFSFNDWTILHSRFSLAVPKTKALDISLKAEADIYLELCQLLSIEWYEVEIDWWQKECFIRSLKIEHFQRWSQIFTVSRISKPLKDSLTL